MPQKSHELEGNLDPKDNAANADEEETIDLVEAIEEIVQPPQEDNQSELRNYQQVKVSSAI